jgi:hypothetical protein
VSEDSTGLGSLELRELGLKVMVARVRVRVDGRVCTSGSEYSLLRLTPAASKQASKQWVASYTIYCYNRLCIKSLSIIGDTTGYPTLSRIKTNVLNADGPSIHRTKISALSKSIK